MIRHKLRHFIGGDRVMNDMDLRLFIGGTDPGPAEPPPDPGDTGNQNPPPPPGG